MKDWTRDCAVEIDEMGSSDESAGWVQEMIIKHCPFKQDVAYMPVPRCDSCAHYTQSTQECAALRTGPLNVIFTSPDFGCVKWKERT